MMDALGLGVGVLSLVISMVIAYRQQKQICAHLEEVKAEAAALEAAAERVEANA